LNRRPGDRDLLAVLNIRRCAVRIRPSDRDERSS
ncbi:hypothetical protein HaLaN_08727, partial [Haematococcus lacustris]